MNIVSWNIQAGQGVDGVTDLDRIHKLIRQMGESDIVCLQEVLQLDASETSENRATQTDSDQVAVLSQYFPEYTSVFGAAVDRWTPTGRLRFGNLILSRLPVLFTVSHKLPQPCDPDTKNMPRQAIEVVVANNDQIYRVVTTHLEYFSAIQRRAHVNYLCELQRETTGRASAPSIDGGEGVYASGPETAATIFCGDFNLNVDSDDYQRLTELEGDSALTDAWRLAHPDTEHAPTCGIYDHVQWQEGPHCRDFFFVSNALQDQVVDVAVNTQTDASDHQPVKLKLSSDSSTQ